MLELNNELLAVSNYYFTYMDEERGITGGTMYGSMAQSSILSRGLVNLGLQCFLVKFRIFAFSLHHGDVKPELPCIRDVVLT